MEQNRQSGIEHEWTKNPFKSIQLRNFSFNSCNFSHHFDPTGEALKQPKSETALKITDQDPVDIYLGFKENNSPFNGGSLIWSNIKCWTSDRSIHFSHSLTYERLLRVLLASILLVSTFLLNAFLFGIHVHIYPSTSPLEAFQDVKNASCVYYLCLPSINMDVYMQWISLFMFVASLTLLSIGRDRWVKLVRYLYISIGFLLIRMIFVVFSPISASFLPDQSLKSVFLNALALSSPSYTLGLPSINAGIVIVLVMFIWTYHGRLRWYLGLLSLCVVLSHHLLLLSSRFSCVSDLFITHLILYLLHFTYHSAVWVFHSTGKLGWLGYDWDHPFVYTCHFIWFIDGLKNSRMKVFPPPKSPFSPVVPGSPQVSASVGSSTLGK